MLRGESAAHSAAPQLSPLFPSVAMPSSKLATTAADAEGGRSVSPKSTASSAITDEPTAICPRLQQKMTSPQPNAAAEVNSSGANNPTAVDQGSNPTSLPAFSHFTAANLFGLFEKITSGVKMDAAGTTKPRMDISPNLQNINGIFFDGVPLSSDGKKGSEGNKEDEYGSRNENNNNNNGSGNGKTTNLLSSAAESASSSLSCSVAPIDHLLQISQQMFAADEHFRGNAATRQQRKTATGNTRKGNGRTSGNGDGGAGGGGAYEGRNSSGNGGNNEENGNENGNGNSAGGGNERKRSYPYTFQYCVLCQKNVHSSKLPCHIRQCHVGKPMFQCPVCDFTSTYSKNNVKSHMVSLHGLAGDPISYMDQYSVQVEEFMKKCFPNVRGRGRPVHGRLSPGKQPAQLPGGPSSTVGGSGANAADPFRPAGGEFVSAQRRQHSSQRGGRAQRERGGQQQKTAGDSGGPEGGQRAQPQFGASPPLLDVYGAMGLGLLGAKGGGELGAGADTFPLANPNGFGPSPFNPFLYLQQLNGLFSTAFASEPPPALDERAGTVAVAAGDHHLPKNVAVPNVVQGQNATPFSLEECLNLSQKFLKEMDSKDKSEAAKESFVCHSSSSTASPPASAHAPMANPGEPEHWALRTDCPRYFPHPLQWTVLEGPALDNTVFQTFNNSSQLIEKLDLSAFELLLAQNGNSLLTPAQKETVASTRQQLGLQSFEIMFAVHRLDLAILKPEQIGLVARIAPTDADIRRFALFEQANSLGPLDEDEQFVLQLAKIDRLREKLRLMALMAGFDERVAQLNQRLLLCCSAAKLLFDSAPFHTLVHLLLTCCNLIGGDFSAQLVRGFPALCVPSLCAFRFPDGHSLLELLARTVRAHFPEIVAFLGQSKTIADAAKVDFAGIERELRSLERAQALVERELQSANGTEGNRNQQLANVLTHCELECAQLRDGLQSTQSQLSATSDFFGRSADCPDERDKCQTDHRFLSAIGQFLGDLQQCVDSL